MMNLKELVKETVKEIKGIGDIDVELLGEKKIKIDFDKHNSYDEMQLVNSFEKLMNRKELYDVKLYRTDVVVDEDGFLHNKGPVTYIDEWDEDVEVILPEWLISILEHILTDNQSMEGYKLELFYETDTGVETVEIFITTVYNLF